MKLTDALADLGRDKSIELAERMAKNLDIQWNDGVAIVFKAIVSNPDRVPRNIGSNIVSFFAFSKWYVTHK